MGKNAVIMGKTNYGTLMKYDLMDITIARIVLFLKWKILTYCECVFISVNYDYLYTQIWDFISSLY